MIITYGQACHKSCFSDNMITLLNYDECTTTLPDDLRQILPEVNKLVSNCTSYRNEYILILKLQ